MIELRDVIVFELFSEYSFAFECGQLGGKEQAWVEKRCKKSGWSPVEMMKNNVFSDFNLTIEKLG